MWKLQICPRRFFSVCIAFNFPHIRVQWPQKPHYINQKVWQRRKIKYIEIYALSQNTHAHPDNPSNKFPMRGLNNFLLERSRIRVFFSRSSEFYCLVALRSYESPACLCAVAVGGPAGSPKQRDDVLLRKGDSKRRDVFTLFCSPWPQLDGVFRLNCRECPLGGIRVQKGCGRRHADVRELGLNSRPRMCSVLVKAVPNFKARIIYHFPTFLPLQFIFSSAHVKDEAECCHFFPRMEGVFLCSIVRPQNSAWFRYKNANKGSKCSKLEPTLSSSCDISHKMSEIAFVFWLGWLGWSRHFFIPFSQTLSIIQFIWYGSGFLRFVWLCL